ncbi:BTAD domain-containing putative transcriptional regulator [Nonomuraea ferruginea]
MPDRKVRVLLAALVARGGGPVPADRLIDDLWGDRPPRDPAGTLQARVSQLRRALGSPSLVRHGPSGYRLDGVTVDAALFRTLLTSRVPASPGGGAPERAAVAEEALALWRGPAYADFADEGFAAAEIARLGEQRLTAMEELSEIRLTLGEPVDLGALVAEQPLRERLTALHMRALYRDGRQSEALAAFAALRARLAEELGVDPAPEVRDLHQAILRQDPSLPTRRTTPSHAALLQPGSSQVGASRTVDGSPGARTNLPAPVTDLIGRDGDVAEVRALLGERRLVTLAGPGGVGKTRLAVAAAGGLTSPEVYPGGVWLVELIGAGGTWPRRSRERSGCGTTRQGRCCPGWRACWRPGARCWSSTTASTWSSRRPRWSPRCSRPRPDWTCWSPGRSRSASRASTSGWWRPFPGTRRCACSPIARGSSPVRPWPPSASGSTASRWRWSWRPPGYGRSASRHWPPGSTTGSGC